MEAIFIYLIKSAALIAAFFGAYYFLLRQETFFKSNRWFLLLGLVTSVILPLVTFKKVIWIETAPKMDWENMPVLTATEQPESFEINWVLILAGIYIIGALAFVLRFLFDFGSLARILKGKTIEREATFKLVDVNENVSPFSYFNYIVYNSSLYSEAELVNILAHERVHCTQKHTADVLLARLFCIVFWYNPFVWLYQKAILQNLEFIADSEAFKNIPDKTAYQFTLLKVTTHENCVAISNHFYQSLIKKRIVMLNKNQSEKWNSWKYLLIVPALTAFMFYFQVKVIAQEKRPVVAAANVVKQETVTVVIDKNTTDAELKTEAKRIKETYDVTLKFSKVKRNANGEIIAIKAEFKDKNTDKKGVYQVSSEEPIKPLRFSKNSDGAIGFSNPRGIQIFKSQNVADIEAPEAPEAPESSDFAEAPEAPEMPDVFVRNNQDGKMFISVNGETVDIDMDGIKADVDAAIASIGNIDVRLDSREIKRITKDAIREAKRALRNAGPELERARIEIERARPEIERAAREIELSKPELEQAKREIEQAREELKQARAELQKHREEMEKAKTAKK